MIEEKKQELQLSSPESTNYPDPEVKPSSTRRIFSAEEKLRILAEVETMEESGEIGAYLRRKGIYSSYLSRWKKEKESGILDQIVQRKKGRKAHTQEQHQEELARLRAENQRLQAQLTRAELIIDIQKKVSNLLGLGA